MFNKSMFLALVLAFAVGTAAFAAFTTNTAEGVRAEMVTRLGNTSNLTPAQLQDRIRLLVVEARQALGVGNDAVVIEGVLLTVNINNFDEAMLAMQAAGIPTNTIATTAVALGVDAAVVNATLNTNVIAPTAVAGTNVVTGTSTSGSGGSTTRAASAAGLN